LPALPFPLALTLLYAQVSQLAEGDGERAGLAQRVETLEGRLAAAQTGQRPSPSDWI